jgi:hypothetical protein
VKIFVGSDFFEANANVVYSQANLNRCAARDGDYRYRPEGQSVR